MRELSIGKHRVTMYDDIAEMPVKRYHVYNRMMLVDAGVGSDITDFDRHIGRALAYDRKEQRENLLLELKNLRQSVYFVLNNINPKMMAFAALVKKIDDTECEDLTDDGLRRVTELLSDVPIGEVTASSEAVKKKIDQDLVRVFPKIFDDATVKDYYDRLRKRTLLVLQGIVEGIGGVQGDIDRLTDDLLVWSRPAEFEGRENAEVRYDKQFEKICVVMAQNLHNDPKRYTVQEYFSAYEYILESNKKHKN